MRVRETQNERTQGTQPGAVGYPGVSETAAETWTPPGWPVDTSITDAEGHPLTWGRVRQAHEWLVAHASCEQAATAFDSSRL